METNPLLARRIIPVRERLQKALAVLFLTALILAAVWFLADGSLERDVTYIASMAGAALVGLCGAAYFWFRKEEVPRTKEQGKAIRERIEDDRKGSGWIARLGYNTRRFLAGIVVVAGLLTAVAGLGVLGVQVYRYLRFGAWDSYSLLEFVAPYCPWFQDPESWFGLHRIVTKLFALVPVSLALILLGWLIAGFGSALRQRVRRQGRR